MLHSISLIESILRTIRECKYFCRVNLCHKMIWTWFGGPLELVVFSRFFVCVCLFFQPCRSSFTNFNLPNLAEPSSEFCQCDAGARLPIYKRSTWMSCCRCSTFYTPKNERGTESFETRWIFTDWRNFVKIYGNCQIELWTWRFIWVQGKQLNLVLGEAGKNS